jgi:hypothetical protein
VDKTTTAKTTMPKFLESASPSPPAFAIVGSATKRRSAAEAKNAFHGDQHGLQKQLGQNGSEDIVPFLTEMNCMIFSCRI